MSRLPPLEWLRTFEAAARLENFTAAADDLGLTQAAVSQQMRKLESLLGRKLFRRLARGVELTADGASYLPHVRVAFDHLHRSTWDMFASRRARPVTIAAPASFAALWLAPRLPRLLADLDGVSVSISSIHRPADYEAEAADIEIRFGTGELRGYVATRLIGETLSPVCAPGLLQQSAKDETLFDNWAELPALRVAGPRDGWAEWCERAGRTPPAAPAVRFDSLFTALEAAKAGTGILLASLPLSADALSSGSLVRLSEIEIAMNAGHWLLRRDSVKAEMNCDRVWQWLAREGARS